MHDADEVLRAFENACPRAAAADRTRAPDFNWELARETGAAVALQVSVDHQGTWREKLDAKGPLPRAWGGRWRLKTHSMRAD